MTNLGRPAKQSLKGRRYTIGTRNDGDNSWKIIKISGTIDYVDLQTTNERSVRAHAEKFLGMTRAK